MASAMLDYTGYNTAITAWTYHREQVHCVNRYNTCSYCIVNLTTVTRTMCQTNRVEVKYKGALTLGRFIINPQPG